MVVRHSLNIVPDVIEDRIEGLQYEKMNFLGRGGFAKCFEFKNLTDGKIVAGKVVSKAHLEKQTQHDKILQEIEIHKCLNHDHIVKFYSCFEDRANLYLILELCSKRSLMEMHKRRRKITEYETRYFLLQLISGIQYLHNERIIHRDLKLGNIFINDEMNLKIGDFGLATLMQSRSKKKKTLCGTPNYIAPEVLTKSGHGFEADIWSLGCIMYVLLIGKPPFETTSLKDTYDRIKRCVYERPTTISSEAENLISMMLSLSPELRPVASSLKRHKFFNGYTPTTLPQSCLTTAPRFDDDVRENNRENEEDGGRPKIEENGSEDFYATELHDMVSDLYNHLQGKEPVEDMEEIENPAYRPFLWVAKWVDYSDKYGLGYALCDDSVGVLFNDSTRLILTPDGESLQYIQRNGHELFYSSETFPDSLYKKFVLLKYFKNYMKDNLLKTGSEQERRGNEMARWPYLRHWFRTRSAIILHFSNGTLQLNFFTDHSKIVICPLLGALTYIDSNGKFFTYPMNAMKDNGVTHILVSRIRYARMMIEKIRNSKSSGRVRSHYPEEEEDDK
ncbi:hypothetical protein SNEBB_001280 [Seison nebaliae]|nr:hypothetical protein SNEBB_001280 [Seison nebaliae]